MIVAFSTSSPVASVALLSEEGHILASAERESLQRASAVCMHMLDELLHQTGRTLTDATLFAADLGPGSFTGVRVGVTLAKTLAFVHRALTMGAPCFDLIDPLRTVVVPSKKDEYFVRHPGHPAYRTSQVPQEALGYGFEGDILYPSASRFGPLLAVLPRLDPHRLNPEYLIEPSISQPKKPFGGPHA